MIEEIIFIILNLLACLVSFYAIDCESAFIIFSQQKHGELRAKLQEEGAEIDVRNSPIRFNYDAFYHYLSFSRV